jgi:hypothetical protein
MPVRIPAFDEFPVQKGRGRSAVAGFPAFDAAAPIASAASIFSAPTLGGFAGGIGPAAVATGACPSPVLDRLLGGFQGFGFLRVNKGAHSILELAQCDSGRFFCSWELAS